MNDTGQVACHYYSKFEGRAYPEDFHTLMHESLEMNESLEHAVARGLQEEFSMEAKLIRFVGSLVVNIGKEPKVEKTVLYFLCRLTKINKRDLNDSESISEIRWMDIDDLIRIMKAQGEKSGPSCDESKILLDVKKSYILAK